MTEPRRAIPHRAVVAVAVIAGTLAVATWPGALNVDALTQVGQARSGAYNDWHSGVLVPLWRPFFARGVDAGWVYLASVVGLALGLFGVLAHATRRRTAVALTVALLAYPPLLGLVIYWGRDQWFTGALLVAVAALMSLASTDRKARGWRLALLLGAVWMMLATRQNAPPAALVLLMAGMHVGSLGTRWRVFHRSGPGAWHAMRPLAVLTGAAGLITVAMLFSQELIRRTADVSHVHPEQQTFFYDLAAISIDTDSSWFPASIYHGDVATLRRTFDVVDVLPLVQGPAPVVPAMPRGEYRPLLSAWTHAVRENPGSYLRARLLLFLRQLAITGPATYVFHDRVSGNAWGYQFAFPRAFAAVRAYLLTSTSGSGQRGGPLHAVWVYVLVTIIGLGWFRSDRPARRALAWACAATLVNLAGFFVGAAAASYRFAWPSVVVGCLVAVVFLADRVRAPRGAPVLPQQFTPDVT